MTSTVKSAARWLWDHKKLVVGTSLAAAGAYAGYVMYQKKRELDALCEELMGQVSTTSRSEESRSAAASLRGTASPTNTHVATLGAGPGSTLT